MKPTHRKPTAPGKILLEEFLSPMGMSLEDFTKKLGKGWTLSELSDLINGKKLISEKIASDFSRILGTSPEFWIVSN